MEKILVIFLMLFVFTSCGDFKAYSNHELGEQREETSGLSDFSTRLSNTLLISGESCRGGEVTESLGQSYICEVGQWLITVDNKNICTPEGCTEVEIIPIIALLVPTSSQGETDFYDIEEAIEVSEEISSLLQTVTVRFRFSDRPQVQFK